MKKEFQNLEQLLSEGETERALENLKTLTKSHYSEFVDDVTQLQNQWNTVHKDFNIGTLTQEQKDTRRVKILNGTTQLISTIKSFENVDVTNQPKRENNRYLFIWLIAGVMLAVIITIIKNL